jgi:Plasmid encoded RepA protein
VKAFDMNFEKDSSKRVIWNSTIQLTDDYFNSLANHAIPLDERALAALSNNAMALDIYAWLAQRLHRIPHGNPQFVSWVNLQEQFGKGYNDMKSFKQVFRRTLQVVTLQYQSARIQEDINKGLMLYNSPTPIPTKTLLL